jgi:hypothetical protein
MKTQTEGVNIMKINVLKFASIALAVFFFHAGVCLGDDLDDGISKFTDETIAKDDELGKVDPNINYIILRAKAKGGSTSSGGSSGNINSAIIGPGSNVKGDIIIIDESRGDKTQVVK